ncbi:Translation initiation factor eIF-2B subunit gamma [Thelohanellus kitauei]|uniref:Translation initiation factor eIF2B subunit gamma n=1 Tax=Thelohanellus kitauei TaxID=669202 RepID=A0A0C2JID3_THEKT|nr:Translation initiation factor eIF-2B subunit gamma [Thelohanellus kitauei]
MATTSGSRTGDFCSVVVAGGYGINLLPLTVSDPKYLLSVGNYPLIYYSLRSLEDAGFCDTLLVTRGQWLQEIQEAVENLKMKIKCEYLVLPDQYESNTASVLFWIKPKLKCEDILVLSGDVYGDVEIKAMAATYRKRNASLCMYAQRHPEDMGYDLLECGVHPSSITKIPDDPNNICEYLAFDPKDDKLLLCEYDTDISETISIPRRLYRKYMILFIRHPDFKICHKVLDLHLYMLKRSVVNLITPQSLLDYKSDLVCYLLNKQFLEENKPVPPQLFENEEDTPFTPGNHRLNKDSKYTCVQNADLYPSDELIRCFVHFSTGQSLCLRVNNAPVLYISNMMVF